jgi:hypothetical protein
MGGSMEPRRGVADSEVFFFFTFGSISDTVSLGAAGFVSSVASGASEAAALGFAFPAADPRRVPPVEALLPDVLLLLVLVAM